MPYLPGLLDRYTPHWLAELLTCSFCLAHHTPYLLALACFFPALWAPWPWLAFLLKLPVYSLAATRAGNVLNWLLPADARY